MAVRVVGPDLTLAHVKFVQPGIGAPPYVEEDPPPPPSSVVGVDLAATNFGLHVIFRANDTADFVTQTGKWVGGALEWAAPVIVLADAGGYGAAPSLAVARNQDLYAGLHDGSDTVRIFRSGNYALSWSERVTAPVLTGRYPRLLIIGDLQLVLFYSPADAASHLYGSTDHYETVTLLASFPTSEQAASLRVDRHGVMHLLAQNGTDVVQHTSKSGRGWTDQGVQIAARSGPAAAGYANAFGAVFAWDTAPTPDMLQLYRTESDFTTIRDGPYDVTNLYPQQVPGVAVDRWRNVWVVLQPAAGWGMFGGIPAGDSPRKAIELATGFDGGMGVF